MLIGTVLAALVTWSGLQAPIARPTPDQRAWQDLGIGVFFHFAPNTYTGKEYDDLSLPLSQFNPEKLNTDQWADAAVAIGAKYVVLVAKHAGGFCLWPTKTTDYGIASTPWRAGKGDIVADLAKSCRKRGLKFGVYLSPADGKHGAGGGGSISDPVKQSAYQQIYREQLTELLSEYGPITEIWFDGSLTFSVTDLVHKFAPHANVFQGPAATMRWVGNEDGFAPYPAWNSLSQNDAKTGVATALHGDPDGDAWMPLEVDVSLHRPDWFWHTNFESHIVSLDNLMSIYYRSVGRGANLLINLPPDPSGLIAEADVRRAKEFGDEIRRRFGHPIASTHGRGDVVTLTLAHPTQIDQIELQEDIALGERVREHVAEARVNGEWKEIERGSAIGQRRLAPVTPITVDAVRIRTTKSVGEPAIRRLAIYDTGATPPADWADETSLWAADTAGSWDKEGAFSFDLTSKLQAATMYRVRFVGSGGHPVSLSGVEFIQDGESLPHLVRPEKGRSDAFVLTITGIPRSAIFRGTLSGAAKGSVLVQRI